MSNVHVHVKGEYDWLKASLFDRTVYMHLFHTRNVYVVIVRMTRNVTSGNKNSSVCSWLVGYEE